jgi:GNAT superfamily N-acetyltransferase
MLAAIIGGKIRSYLWVERETARIDYMKIEVPLPKGHVYISKVLVVPEYRRAGLAKAMYQHLALVMGDVTAHSACVAENRPMHLLFTKLGWDVRLQLRMYKAGPLRWYEIEPVSDGRTERCLNESSTRRMLFDIS